MPVPTSTSTWTFRISAALTLVGAASCFFVALTSPPEPVIAARSMSSFESRIVIDDGALFEATSKSAKSIKAIFKRIDGSPASDFVPKLIAQGDEKAKFECETTNAEGEAKCSITPTVSGALIVKFEDMPMLHRGLIHSAHSAAKMQVQPVKDGEARLRWTVQMARPWTSNAEPLVEVRGQGRHSATCTVRDGKMDLDCDLISETAGEKKIQLLRPYFDETIQVTAPAMNKPNPKSIFKSQIVVIGKTSEKAKEQIVSVKLVNEKNQNTKGQKPPLKILSQYPVNADCNLSNDSAVSECRLFSPYEQKIQVWSDAPFETGAVELSFQNPGYQFNRNLVFEDNQWVSLTLPSFYKGQFERSIPRLAFPASKVVFDCFPETEGRVDCVFNSSEPGIHFGNYRPLNEQGQLRQAPRQDFQIKFER